MSPLITELKRQHVAILEVLDAVNTLGIASARGQEKIMAAKTLLLAHLAKEDETLYPVLRKGTETDGELRRYLEILSKDMARISESALGFFQKYAASDHGAEFARDFGSLSARLSSRIRKEEAILYPAYERLVGAEPPRPTELG
jgi:iron-sulfur cluster repair protein YtfE (RIC family)